MNILFLEPAEAELQDAIDYYNLQLEGLGERFIDEVFDALSFITQFPSAGGSFTTNTRKITLRKFPFNLIYMITDAEIIVIAVAHQHREPEYWSKRVE